MRESRCAFVRTARAVPRARHGLAASLYRFVTRDCERRREAGHREWSRLQFGGGQHGKVSAVVRVVRGPRAGLADRLGNRQRSALVQVLQNPFRPVGIEEPHIRVSARMLYEMAKRNDEWTGTAYEGSSIRGALSGFHRNGVCSEAIAPDRGSASWVLTYARAKEARDIRLGAYYRLQPDLSDYHAAINEIGAIYVSAQIHSNWEAPENGRIMPGGRPAGGHAFVLFTTSDSTSVLPMSVRVESLATVT